ncbi:hypothetical protein KOW79_020294 [Hemibagrus wyckioides]|uniref:Beta-sarcoglycan n=1 Tax=Hemibagrus wyckioides TaxID=337641 RepID=A0A9D3N8H8_9TELE|nr:hypothetical protein KOW79_020294 [Hemibagrus wyckioides]
MASEQESSNGPVKKSMREKAIERRAVSKEHNSNFKAGYVPIEEERLHKTGLRGRKGNIAVCVIVLLFLLALINLIITLVIWTVIRIGPNGCDSMEFHESGLLRFKQKADMGVVHPLHKSTVGGRKDQDLVITGNNNPVVFQQGNTKLSVEKDKTSITSDLGVSFTDPRTQTTFFSTDFDNHEFHLPKQVKVLNVKKASTERITSNASSDLMIKGDGKAIIRGNEGVFIMGKTVEFRMGGDIELKADNSIILNGSVMFSPSRIPNTSQGSELYFNEGLERNQLKCLPRGLGNIKSLKVLQLSHNRISEIGPADLAGCTHLNELHLQYNLINTIHPEAFKDLQELKVLDVSYNLLATIPVPAYLSLRNLNVLVDISGNRWSCDCNLKTIRRWLSFDSELGNPAWEVVCFSPPHHAGKSLLYLEESDLACPQPVYSTPGVKKEVTVDEGMEFILSCSTANQDFMHTHWWTPHGQISDSQRFLHISKATERDAGLYVCISGYQEEHVSVFSLHVRKRAHDRRLRREAQIGSFALNSVDKDNIQRNVPVVRAVQQSQFALAVSLSVIITFIVAFVLGVVLRPFLEKCYKQIRSKRKSTTSPPNSRTSSTAQRPYVNEGYTDTDDQEQEVHEGPRVTFGGVTEIHEQGGVPYYVTVEGNSSGSNTDVAVHKEVPLREENKEMTSPTAYENLTAESSKGMQFEYIPDPEDTAEFDQSISPTSSLSGEQQESYEIKESIEQSVDSPTVSIYNKEDEQTSTDQQATIPGFITDPFPLKMSESKEESVDELDPDLWNDSGESFSFTEGSPRSSSRVSHVAALGYPNIKKEMSVDELSDRPSSCNSSKSGESEGGPTEHKVNPEDDEELETQISYSENDDINYDENRFSDSEVDIQNKNPKTGKRHDTITLDPTDIHMTYTQGDSFDDELFTEYKESYPSSNSDYEDEPAQYHVHPVYRTSQKATSLMEDVSLTSSKEDEDEQGEYPRSLEIRLEDKDSTTDAIAVKSPESLLNMDYDNSSSSTDIEVKSSKEKERGIFKGLSGLSARLFNRSGSETKKAVQPEPDTATTNSKGTGGSLGLSFKKQPITPSETVGPTTNENFFVTIGQAFDGQPKLKNSIRFSMSEPKSPHQQKSISEVDRISESGESHVSSSIDDSIFGKIDQTLDPITRVKRYLHFSQSQSYPPIQPPPRSTEKIIPTEVVKTESKKFSPEDNFFAKIDASLDDLPKVKRKVINKQASQLIMEDDAEPRVSKGRKDTGNFEEVDVAETDRNISALRSELFLCFGIDEVQGDL